MLGVANSCAWSRCFGRAKLRKSHGSPGPSPRGSARLIADGLAGRFPAEEVDIQDEMLKRAQNLQLKLRALEPARGPHRSSQHGREARGGEWAPMEALREKREALRQRRIRTRDVAALAQIERELFEVEEQLVSKKIAERLPGLLAAKSATLAALRSWARAPYCAEPAGQRHRLAVSDAVESGTEQKPGQNATKKKKRSSDRLNILLFFYRKQFIQLKPICAMTSELSDRIWGRLGLSAVRAVPLEEPRAPSAKGISACRQYFLYS